MHVAILAHRGSVPGYGAVAKLLAVAKVVLASGIGVLGIERHAHVAAKAVLPAQAGIGEAKGARAHRHVEIVVFLPAELGAAGFDIHRSCRAKVARGLENLTLLTIVERNLLNVVERETAQVYLSVLGVTQLDAVVEHSQVVGAHRADVDGLDAAHSAIVLHLDSREIAYGVGNGVAVQAFKFLAAEGLGRDDLGIGLAAINYYILKVLKRVNLFNLGHRANLLSLKAQAAGDNSQQ